MLMVQLCRATSRRLPAELQETVQIISSTVQDAQRAEDRREATQCGETVSKKRKRLKRGGDYQKREGMCLSPEKLLGAIENRGTGLSVENFCGWMLAELLREGALRSFRKVHSQVSLGRQKPCL